MAKKITFDDIIKAGTKKKIQKAKKEVLSLNCKVNTKIKKLQLKKKNLQQKVRNAKNLSEQRQEIKKLKETLKEFNRTNEAKRSIIKAAKTTGRLLKSTAKGTAKTLQVSRKVAALLILEMNRLANAMDRPKRTRKKKITRKKRRK